MAETQSLVPEWLSFNKELPASSQDKSHKPQFEREKHKRFGKQNSYNHLTHTPPSHPSALSSNWRNSDLNPRVLNRSKSSPVFDLKDPTAEPPKSPDRSNNSLPPQSSERSQFPPRSPKLKLKTRPPLMSSRSQPNLFTMDKMKDWQQQKLTTTRSPPSSRSSSFSSSGPAPLAPPQISVTPAPASQQFGISLSADDAVKSDSEIDKLRALVPAAAVAPLPKPPSRLANNNRKNTTHTKPQEKPKKPMLAFPAQLKKASSEPSLFAHGTADDFRRAKALKLEKELKLKETVENKDKTMAARNNFFMDVIKLEKQLQDLSEEELESAAANDEGREDSVLSSSLELPVPLGQEEESPELGRLSPTINREDEERFLREMGWVSEEEEHVPELDEKEIAEVKLKLRTQGGGSTPSSPLRNSYAAIRRVSLQSA